MAEKKVDVLNKELFSLMDALINGGIKIKSAAEVGKRAVEYTRGDEIIKWFMNNKDTLHKVCPNYLVNSSVSDEGDVAALVEVLIQNGFIYRAQYQPLEGPLEKSATGSFKRPTWPKRLIKTQKQRFDATGFYIISYEGNQKWNYLMLSAMLLGIFAICMFQAWPLMLKLAMWYLSVVLLSVMLAMVLSRLVLFAALWFFGFDFWLFPNLFDEDLGVLDSFKPLYSCLYRNDTLTMLGCRLLCALFVAVSIKELGKTHDIRDVGNFAKQSFLDILEWGHQKLTALPEEKSAYESIGVDLNIEFGSQTPGENDPDEEEDDYRCLLGCGYGSLHQLMKECMLDCGCMDRLLNDDCISSCNEDTLKVLKEAKSDVCKRSTPNKKHSSRDL